MGEPHAIDGDALSSAGAGGALAVGAVLAPIAAAGALPKHGRGDAVH
jgi:hypothetical protein